MFVDFMGYPSPRIYMFVHTYNTTELSCIVMQKNIGPQE